jgi:2-dehydropantoate 2-reductase
MDPERYEKYHSRPVLVNGTPVHFNMVTPDQAEPADLIIVSTKATGLEAALDTMETSVGPDTIIISLLNGISREEIIAGQFDRNNIIDCVAIGMDAVREGTDLTYAHMGRLQIGSRSADQDAKVAALAGFFERMGIPFEVVPDIKRAMWNKFMINVGINQTCMVYETDYGHACAPGEALEDMKGAMHEVIAIADRKGIRLTEEDFEKNLALLRSLNPSGLPSMRQDALAHRRSEVELFAGTMIRLGREMGIPVPVNEKYYEKIMEMEKTYS